jgi:biopolymer transport protein ExbB
MNRPTTAPRRPTRRAAIFALATLALAGGAAEPATNPNLDFALRQAERLGRRALAWYRRTPPPERITWGGLAACAALGLGVAAERMARLRRRRVIPAAFVARFQARLAEGKIDRGKGLDYCELNPSPAARVALAAFQRWGRPAADLERAVALARGREVDRLRRNVGTLRRVAALSPLIGLLGTLTAAGRTLTALGAAPAGAAWGPALATALVPLTAGVALAILALVAYDGLVGRVEALAGDLDRLGAETVDAVALSAVEPPRTATRPDPAATARIPHPIRIEIPESIARTAEVD